jgi:TonB-linked SusC/RagA family outer membrane protein
MAFQALRQPDTGRRIILSKTTFLAMKLTAIIMLAGFMQVSALGYSQKITLEEKNAPQAKVIQDIKRFGYQFFLPDDFTIQKKFNINVHDANIDEVLEAFLKDEPWTYKVVDNVVLIRKKEIASPVGEIKPQKVVDATGTVLNESGQPLSGANVTDKRTGRATITNAKGIFQFHGIETGSTLTISFVGYAAQEVKISDATSAVIYMKPAKSELDKIVVQAYGNTSQRLTTSDITTVTSAEIERHPVANVLTALQGNVPGMVVQQVNGYASAPFTVEIRGRSQIDPTRPSEPLYVIDGVPLTVLESGKAGNYQTGSTGFLQNGLTGPASGQSPLFSLNPNDIESVSVLKDADATAIYGSRGANGVILITTKSGKPGKATFDVNVYQGASNVTRSYSMLNTQQYLQVRHEAFNNDNITPNPGNAYDLLSWDTTRYTNIQKALWGGTGRTIDVETALTAGDKQNSFRIGGAYHKETDILTVSGSNQRASVQTNLSHRSNDERFNLSFTSTYSFANLNLQSLPGNVTLPPDMPQIFLPNKMLNWLGWQPLSNPYGGLLQPYDSKTGFLNSRLRFQYTILNGLDISALLGYSTTHNGQTFLYPIISQDPAYNPTGSASFGDNNNTNAILEPQIEYKKELWIGQLNALAGGTYQSVSQDGNVIQGSGYVDDNLLRSVANAPSRTATDNNSQYKYTAGFVRLNYNISNKYILNISGRRDGSSRFGPGKQFGNFGAVGAAWIFSEEQWLKKKLPFLSFGKLRGSYGITGSDDIGDYQYLSAWANNQNAYIQGSPAYLTSYLFNPDLQWQVNKKLEGAINLGFIKDRILFELAWYDDKCGNQLLNSPLPAQTGFSFVTQNLPATIQNTGLESTIKVKIIDNTSFHWSVNMDIGANRNKLISFPNIQQTQYAYVYTIGQPLNIAKLLHYTGVDPNTGQYTFQDKQHNGQIDINANDTANDLYPHNLTVKFDGGFGTEFSIKGFTINAFFRFRKQTLQSMYANMPIPGTTGNDPAAILNRWQKPGDKAQFARYTTQPVASDQYFYFNSDGVYCDGSYVRLQNLSVSYSIPSRLIYYARLKGLRLYLQGENLLLITKYKGVDPDVPSFGGMPPARTIVGGIQISL